MKRFALPALLLAGLSACITVNIYFPAPEVRAAAEEIVEETWGDGTDGEQSQSFLRDTSMRTLAAIGSLLSPRAAHAAEANIDVSTAAIRALKASMKDRAPELKPHLAAKRLGLGKDGMLAERSLGDLPLREQAQVRRLVGAENRDRASLYKEIAKANDFGDDRIEDIQGIFAQTWRDKADKGWLIERDNGDWTPR